jgi:hypothetical protein
MSQNISTSSLASFRHKAPTLSQECHKPTPTISYHSFVIAARRKLRLPLFPTGIQCTCGHTTHNFFGNHAFFCIQGNRKRAHNIISKQFASDLSSFLSTAGNTLPNTTLEVEPNLYLQSDPTARPFDISFHPDPTSSHRCPFTTTGADIKITGPPPAPRDTSPEDYIKTKTANADNNLQRHEHLKLGRHNKTATRNTPQIIGDNVIKELYHKNMVLLPFTIDPWAQFG